MNIRSRSAIHEEARQALDRAPYTGRIILIYTAACCGLSILATLLSLFFSDRIAGTGGLSNIGLRSVLSTGQSVLELAQVIVSACLGLGYHIIMLTITRRYEAAPRTLLQGFRHFGPLFRAILLQSFIYLGLIFGATYLSSFLFLMTPGAEAFMEVMAPVMSSMTVMDSAIILDEATLMAATETMLPMFWIMLVVLPLVLVPTWYKFRMVNFCLAENPRQGALAAILKSRLLMRRNRIALFRLDLTLWWFHLGSLLVFLLCYGDVLLALMGVTFPWSATVTSFVFYFLSLGLQVAVNYFAMNRAYAVYAVAYDVLQDDLPKITLPVQQ